MLDSIGVSWCEGGAKEPQVVAVVVEKLVAEGGTDGSHSSLVRNKKEELE